MSTSHRSHSCGTALLTISDLTFLIGKNGKHIVLSLVLNVRCKQCEDANSDRRRLFLGIIAHLTVLLVLNPASNLIFSLLLITSRHRHASTSDLTFNCCINILLILPLTFCWLDSATAGCQTYNQ